MAKYDGWTIEVLNWKKYNPRMDAKKPTWFRLENAFATGHEYFALSPDQKWAWVVILSGVSQKNGEAILLNYSYIRIFAKATDDQLDDLIDFFLKKGSVRVARARPARVSRASGRNLPATDGRTDGDGRTETETGETSPAPDGKGEHPLMEIWNRERGTLAECRGMSKKRWAAAEKLWLEKPSTEYWSDIVKRMAASAFCRGEKNKPGPHENWKADFDFFVQEGTHTKVLEGKYDDRKDPPPPIGDSAADFESQVLDAVGKIVTAISAVGPHQHERAKEFVGPLGWQIVTSEGGWIRTCEKLNDHNVGILKSQWRKFLLSKLAPERGAA